MSSSGSMDWMGSIRGVVDAARVVAETAAREAGTLAKERFGDRHVHQLKDEHGDLVTEVDFVAERIIIDHLRKAFPSHRIISEEAGDTGGPGEDVSWTWIVDPLDGTNNYAVGLPVYGVVLTLLYDNRPVLGVIYDSHLEQMYVAQRGRQSICAQRNLIMKPSVCERLSVSWIQGHGVQNDSFAARLRQTLDASCKRVLRLWAPSLAWCMLARGDLDGIVLYRSEPEDLYAGILLVQEAGGTVVDFDRRPFDRTMEAPCLIACHPSHLEFFLDLVSSTK